jgi:glycosyltransferase involved in cell wall biosynthesis
MEIVVDGIIFQNQHHGGVSRIYSQILPRMCELEDEISIHLLTSGRLGQPLPVHPKIFHRRLFPFDDLLRPRRYWEPLLPYMRGSIQRLAVGTGKNKIWHSSYYTMPTYWQGPVVLTVLDMIHERYQHLFDKPAYDRFRDWKHKCIQAADAVICISDTTKQDIHELYRIDDRKLFVAPLAHAEIFRLLDDDEIPPGLNEKRPFILYIGARAHYKNFHVLIKAYSNWQRQRDIDLVVVGKPFSTQEKEFIRDLGIPFNRIKQLSMIDDLKLCALYNRATLFVYPSLYEGFGIPLLEAMACGCRIVASGIASTIEVAGDVPYYFTAGDDASLLQALNSAIFDSDFAPRRQLGIERAKAYSWWKTAEQILELYRILGGREANSYLSNPVERSSQ